MTGTSRVWVAALVALAGGAAVFAEACRSSVIGASDADAGDSAPSTGVPTGSPSSSNTPGPPTPIASSEAGPPASADAGVCSGALATKAPPQTNALTAPSLTVAADLKLEAIAQVPSARQLVALPNGDLLVSTLQDVVYLVPSAEADGASGAPVVYAKLPETPAQGLTFDASTCTVYFASQHDVFSTAYADAQTSASSLSLIAHVRQGPVAPNSDGDVHVTTSLGVAGGSLYAGVGSSCNACVEADPTRATVQVMNADGSHMTTRATRFRNAIAIATNPETGTLWAGGAGQDSLAEGHPYEFFDALTLHPGVADYGWPACEENHTAYVSGSDCTNTIAPRVVLPAYSTIIGAAFYPSTQQGTYAFPAARRGLYLTAHGSWHQVNGAFAAPPRVAFFAMDGDTPRTPVDWNDPTRQFQDVVSRFQLSDGQTRIGRPTGIAVGPRGSLFIADDLNGAVYRVRPR